MKWKSLLGKVFVVLALFFTALSFSSVPAAQASTTASCQFDGCDGQDPQASGCSATGVTIDSFRNWYGTYVELRKSLECNSFWTRVYAAKSAMGYKAQIYATNGPTYSVSGFCQPDGGGGLCDATWTRMSFGGELMSCAQEASKADCTAWHRGI